MKTVEKKLKNIFWSRVIILIETSILVYRKWGVWRFFHNLCIKGLMDENCSPFNGTHMKWKYTASKGTIVEST